MKGSECKLLKYLNGSSKRFIIPVYQRNYDWKIEHCKQLYDDLVKVIKNKHNSHFFGSIVSVYNERERYLIIDGQQRLTTISLLLLAIYNIIKEDLIVPENANLGQFIYEEYLIDKWAPEETRIKLKPINNQLDLSKNDEQAYNNLFNKDSTPIEQSNVTLNYKYFYERILKREIFLDDLYNAIEKLEIINIELDNKYDDPQLIFESLNSTGLNLSEGDKIRNFILMGLSLEDQNSYYKKYWSKIEQCTGYDVGSFVRDYLSVKQQSIPPQKRIYIEFKNYVDVNRLTKVDMLEDLLTYAKRYEILLGKKKISRELDNCIYRLNRIETTITRPFFLEVLRMLEQGKLSEQDVTKVFLFTENYIFRRSICNLPTNSLNKMFLMLHKEIIRYDGTTENYFEKFKYALLSKKDKLRFPDDIEFKTVFETRDVYLMNNKNKTYILERLNNYGSLETQDIYARCDDGTYSVEHIMPQRLTPSWQKELGENYKKIHEMWLHKIANLTLTAYNSKYSNSTFQQKRDMQNGFKDSGIRLNNYLMLKDQWTVAELKERSEHLAGQALKIWALPATKYKAPEKQMDIATLADDTSLSGKEISKFAYKNTEQPVNSWIDMFERVVKLLHEEDKSVLSQLAYADAGSSYLAAYFSYQKSDLRSALEIEPGIYAERNTSTDLKISILKNLFKLFADAEPEDLVFYLEDDDVDPNALLLRYWTYALEHIKKVNSDNNLFNKVKPHNVNRIYSYIGTTGISLCCAVTSKSVRAELILYKPQKEANKSAFDYLLLKKADIEREMGVPLVWERRDEIKSSRIYYQLDNVNLEFETDWEKMAEFQAQWAKKFYNVFEPYLSAKI